MDRRLADAREHDGLEPPPPLLFRAVVAPIRAPRCDHGLDCRLHRGCRLLRVDGGRVLTLAGQSAVLERPLACFGKRHEVVAPEAEVPALAVDDDPLDPGPRPGVADEQVEAVAVGVPAGERLAHLQLCQFLVGVSASAGHQPPPPAARERPRPTALTGSCVKCTISRRRSARDPLPRRRPFLRLLRTTAGTGVYNEHRGGIAPLPVLPSPTNRHIQRRAGAPPSDAASDLDRSRRRSNLAWEYVCWFRESTLTTCGSPPGPD